MNICNLIGRLCADPELRRTNEGTAVCSYRLDVKRPMVKDVTDFLDIVTWRQGAEYLAKYGSKGDVVAVTGQVQTRSWTDGKGNKRETKEIVTTSVELLSNKKNTEASGNTAQGNNSTHGQPSYQEQDFQQIVGPDAQLPF